MPPNKKTLIKLELKFNCMPTMIGLLWLTRKIKIRDWRGPQKSKCILVFCCWVAVSLMHFPHLLLFYTLNMCHLSYICLNLDKYLTTNFSCKLGIKVIRTVTPSWQQWTDFPDVSFEQGHYIQHIYISYTFHRFW